MNKITKAIIVAAGEGKRLRPVSYETPKPLVTVNGKRIIDSIIDCLYLNQITEIYIVVGYKKELFNTLKDKYPSIHLIENPYFDKCNNISSLYVAREFLGNCLILDGDQLINNSKVLDPIIHHSGYSALWTESETSEWLMQTRDDLVVSCSRNGGKIGWQLFSISRWNKEDGSRLGKHLELEFMENHNDQIYWDDIPMFIHADEYLLGVYEINKGDVIEIDNLDELIALDQSYAKYKGKQVHL